MPGMISAAPKGLIKSMPEEEGESRQKVGMAKTGL